MEKLKQLLSALNDEVKSLTDTEDYTFNEYIYENDKDNVKLIAGAGYSAHVDTLCKLTNTGNGFIAHFPSHSTSYQDNYICIDYSEADYLRKLLNYNHNNKTSHKE